MKKIFLVLMSVTLGLSLHAEGLRVVFIGDSITDGNWGVVYNYKPTSAQRSQTDMNHIYGHGYMSLVASYYQAKYPGRGYSFFNRGFSGHRLSDLAARWQEDVLDLRPDVLSILVGINDINFSSEGKEALDIVAWKNLYRQLLLKVRGQNPAVRILLCTPFTTKEGKAGQAVHELAAAVRELAEELGATLVPFDGLFAKLVDRGPSPSYWIWDGIHPTPAGHYMMAELWKKKARLK